MRYRKKPVTVDAIQFDGANVADVQRWCYRYGGGDGPGQLFFLIDPEDRGDDPDLVAQVWDKLHSTWVGVKAGQWIIRGVQNEHYPCDPDVFGATYEAVPE